MARVGFYHLTRTGVEQALPVLLGRVLDAGERAVVLCGSIERVAALNAALWVCPAPDWLPHGTAASGHAARQPIWITDRAEAPNGARALFLIDGAAAPADCFDRVFDLFDGQDEAAVAAARARFAAARDAGHAVEYWRQGARGWEQG